MPHPFTELLAILEKPPADSLTAFIEAGRNGGPGFGFTQDLRWSFAEDPGSKTNSLRVKDSDGFDITDFDPSRIIEGTIIAAYLLGAERAFVDVGGQVEVIEPLLEKAVAEAELAELCGESILGTDTGLDVSVNPRGAKGGKGTQTGYTVRFQIRKGPRSTALLVAAAPVVAPKATEKPAETTKPAQPQEPPAPKPEPAPAPMPKSDPAPEKPAFTKQAPTSKPEQQGDPFRMLALFFGACGVTLLIILILGLLFGFLAGHFAFLCGIAASTLVAGHFCNKKSRSLKRRSSNSAN